MGLNGGVFCVLEGIDGSGKTTLIQNIAKALKRMPNTPKFKLLQEPTNMKTGKKIREMMINKAKLPPFEWLQLFIDDRRNNVKYNILPALEEGYLVLQDRYYYSTAAYQAVSEGNMNGKPQLSANEILRMNQTEGFPEADILFFLQLDPQEAFGRVQEKDETRQIFENLPYLTKVAKNYKQILPSETIYINSTLSPQTSCEKAISCIMKKIPYPTTAMRKLPKITSKSLLAKQYT